MSGYQIVIDKVENTGKAAQRVADGLEGAGCSATLPAGDAGMPGGKCVPKLAAVKQRWRELETAFVSQLEQHAANMAKAAQMYRGNEQAAAQDMTVKDRPTSGPRPV